MWSIKVNILILVSFLHQSKGVGKPFTVNINTVSPIREVDEKYSSFAIGASLIQKRWLTFDFNSVRLQTLARSLGPAYLRLGGTWADFMYFDPDSRGNANPAVDIRELLQDPSYYESLDSYGWDNPVSKSIKPFNITGEDFENINNFTQTVGWKFLFDFNVLLRKNGKWDPTNAKQILDFSIKHGYTNNQLFELGNEPNSMHHAINFTLPAESLANDFKNLRSILGSSEYAPYYHKGTLLIGPDVTKGHTSLPYLTIFLEKAGPVLDAVTWHHYYLDGRTATADDFVDPEVMDSIIPLIVSTKATVDKYMPPDTKMWFGETGSCFGGGATDLSDRYVAGFLLLDKLGLSAKMGMDVVLRQTFYGGRYAMIDENLNPLPDYWLSLFYKVLVGTKVLNVTLSQESRHLRLYAHCTNTARTGYPVGSVTLYGLNVYDDDVSLELGGDLQNQVVDEYLLQHGEGGIASQNVTVNGQSLKMIDNRTLPKIEPRRLSPGQKITIPSRTFGFFVIPKAHAKVCGSSSDKL